MIQRKLIVATTSESDPEVVQPISCFTGENGWTNYIIFTGCPVPIMIEETSSVRIRLEPIMLLKLPIML